MSKEKNEFVLITFAKIMSLLKIIVRLNLLIIQYVDYVFFKKTVKNTTAMTFRIHCRT